MIHIHAPFGMGKTRLIDAFSGEVKNVIKYDDFFHNIEEIETVLNKKDTKISPTSFASLKSDKKLLTLTLKWWLATIIAITLAFIPIWINRDLEENKYLVVKLIPVYAISFVIPWTIIYSAVISYKHKKFFFTWKPKNKIIIIENLDRMPWDLILFLFKLAKNQNKNHFIFTYSMDNLLIRYKEKYGFDETNLYLLLDKFISVEINLSKSSEKSKVIVFNELMTELNIKSFGIQMEHLDDINNFRLMKRALEFIKNNEEYIDFFDLSTMAVFMIYYLSISDFQAYEWLVSDWFNGGQKNENARMGKFKYSWWEVWDFNFMQEILQQDSKLKNSEILIDETPEKLMMSKKILMNIYYKLFHDNRYKKIYKLHNISDQAMDAMEKYKSAISAEENEYVDSLLSLNEIPTEIKIRDAHQKWNEFSSDSKIKLLDLVLHENAELSDSIKLIKAIDLDKLSPAKKVNLLEKVIKGIGNKFEIAFLSSISRNNYLFLYKVAEKLAESNIQWQYDRLIKSSDKNYANSNAEMVNWIIDVIDSYKNDLLNWNSKLDIFSSLDSAFIPEFLILSGKIFSSEDFDELNNLIINKNELKNASKTKAFPYHLFVIIYGYNKQNFTNNILLNKSSKIINADHYINNKEFLDFLIEQTNWRRKCSEFFLNSKINKINYRLDVER